MAANSANKPDVASCLLVLIHKRNTAACVTGNLGFPMDNGPIFWC